MVGFDSRLAGASTRARNREALYPLHSAAAGGGFLSHRESCSAPNLLVSTCICMWPCGLAHLTRSLMIACFLFAAVQSYMVANFSENQHEASLLDANEILYWVGKLW